MNLAVSHVGGNVFLGIADMVRQRHKLRLASRHIESVDLVPIVTSASSSTDEVPRVCLGNVNSGRAVAFALAIWAGAEIILINVRAARILDARGTDILERRPGDISPRIRSKRRGRGRLIDRDGKRSRRTPT